MTGVLLATLLGARDTVFVALRDSIGVVLREPSSQHGPSVWWVVVPNILLVLLTAYYSWQTRQTVKEMRAARGAQVLPRLVAAFEIAGPTVLFPRVVNIGPGSATQIECKLKLEPKGPEWNWRWALLAPGEGQSFTPQGSHPDGSAFQPMWDQIKLHYSHLSLVASYTDAMGERHESVDSAEITETLALSHSVGMHWEKDVVEKIEDHLEKGIQEIEGIRRAVEVQTGRTK